MWIAARALFNDRFMLSAPVLGAALALAALGLAANVPFLPEAAGVLAPSTVTWLGRLHGAAMLAFVAASLWEVAHGAAGDLVEPRRAARRWVALGIGLYAAIALVIELALRGQPVGRLLPALHVAGIGGVSLALAVLVARRSLDAVLGIFQPVPTLPAGSAGTPSRGVSTLDVVPAALTEPTGAQAVAAGAGTDRRPNPALARLTRAMSDEHAYRTEGLSLAALAQRLGLGEAALRALINQELGYRNFNDFLHHYRLREAAERLVAEDLPVLSIALECGYGSIGPFNRAFRQRWGMTPSEYRGASRLPKASAPG
jgi:AraC-like DNA-binding protein